MARETLFIYQILGELARIKGFIEQNCKRVNRKISGKKIMDAAVIKTLDKNALLICAIGLPLKKKWLESAALKNRHFDTVIAPSAVIANSIQIKEGCIICPDVVLTCNIKIGKHSIINPNTTINHDCVIGNYVTICSGVNIAGNVKIGEGCWIGIGATIIQNLRIGKNSFIGAGAVVTRNIPPNTLAYGVPAQPVRKLKSNDWKKIL